ncbi:MULTISPECIES: DUF6415 family natural product biosynthesis protein [unclassified Streptomyces]|uniref:DUF6415 family natural product biosynthesis protein n=1 Tax=unclassified Streptomyces TaxID=2593676 RepID=UPI003656FD1E
MSATQREVDAQLDVAAMRRDAAVLLDEGAPLIRYEDLQAAEHRYRQNLAWLIREVDAAMRQRPEDDIQAKVAMAGMSEARRRLEEIEAVGLAGEVRRVRRLARSVVSLCDHHGTLTGLRMCPVCDKPITADQESAPFDLFRTSSSGPSSDTHTRCLPPLPD